MYKMIRSKAETKDAFDALKSKSGFDGRSDDEFLAWLIRGADSSKSPEKLERRITALESGFSRLEIILGKAILEKAP